MCDVMKKKRKMVERGYTQERLSEAIGIDKSTMCRRFKTGEDFTVGEANKIVSILNLTSEEATQIFLPVVSQ